MSFALRPAGVSDAADIAAVYNYYVRETTATLQEAPAAAESFAVKIAAASDIHPFIVATDNKKVVGYAYAAEWKSRCGYLYTVESSVYVAKSVGGRGRGFLLMESLLARLQKTKMRAVIAVIGLPNPSSVRLHERLGFVKCGELPGVGFKFNKERAVGFWLKSLTKQKNAANRR